MPAAEAERLKSWSQVAKPAPLLPHLAARAGPERPASNKAPRPAPNTRITRRIDPTPGNNVPIGGDGRPVELGGATSVSRAQRSMTHGVDLLLAEHEGLDSAGEKAVKGAVEDVEAAAIGAEGGEHEAAA